MSRSTPTGCVSHVLVVDDERMSVSLVERTFAGNARLRVSGTTSALEALEIARSERVDLVIADQRMPEMTGLEFLGRLRAIAPDTLAIMLTAYPDISLVVQALNQVGIYKFLTKPCDPRDLEITVCRALEWQQLRHHNEQLQEELADRNAELQNALDGLMTT
jgi:DNA-binding NtrC family response regulator